MLNRNTTDFKKGFCILRHTKGCLKISLKFILLKNKPFKNLLQAIFSIKGVYDVTVNHLTSTILIRYNHNIIKKNIFLYAIIEKYHNNDFTFKMSALWTRFNLNKSWTRFTCRNGLITNWEIVSDIPERIRLRHPILFNNKYCCRIIEQNLNRTFKRIKSSHLTGTILIHYDNSITNKNVIINHIEQILKDIPPEYLDSKPAKISRFLLSSLCVKLSLLSKRLPYLSPFNVLFIGLLAAPIFGRSMRAFQSRTIKVDVLDAVAIASSIVARQRTVAAFMVWILDVIDKIKERTEKYSKFVLKETYGKHSKNAWLVKDGSEIQVSVDLLKTGDVIAVSTGENFPVDGKVCAGEGSVDQHVLTGESSPVEKGLNDKVFASTTLIGGRLNIEVTATGKNTIESKIVDIISKADDYNPDIISIGKRLADKAVIPTLALGGLGYATKGYSAALAIINADFGTGIRVAAPTALMSYLAVAARNGILIKNGAALEVLDDVDTFVFDKTGTLTTEIPNVKSVISCNDTFSKLDIIRYAAAVEQRFSHPLALSILRKAEDIQIELPKIDNSKYHIGFGVDAEVNGVAVKVGSLRFMERKNIEVPLSVYNKIQINQNQGEVSVLVAINNRLAGAIFLQSQQRVEARSVIQYLKHRGTETFLISGDHETPTRYLAERLQMDHYYSEVLPQDKGEFIKSLQREGKKVAMIGDGINDAIALSMADISISLRGASDIATDVADIIFMDCGISKIEQLYQYAHRYKNNVRRGFAMIVIPNALCIGGALFGIWGIKISLILNNLFNFVSVLNGSLPLRSIMDFDHELLTK